MSDLVYGNSLWQQTAGQPVGTRRLAGQHQVDVVVVGGGFTGCSAALHLAAAGANTCLLEARTIGYGGSGRNVGLVNAGLWLEPEKVEAALGTRAGTHLNEALAIGPALVFSLIDAHAIECEDTRTGTLHCAHSAAGLANLGQRLRQYRQRGAPVDLLSASETASKCGTERFFGALLDHRAGTVQPLAYVRGLARAALGAGARLHEHSPVQSMSFDGSKWRLATPKGLVQSESVILATNAYHHELPTDARPKCTPVRFFQLATRPLGRETRSMILPERQGAWDTATVMSSFRLDAQGRLIVGAVGSLEGPGRPVHRSWARRKLREMFPDLPMPEFEYAWEGRIAVTTDHLPRIVRTGARALSVYGYSGRGIAPGTVFGKAVAEYLLSGKESRLPLEPIRWHKESLCGIKQHCYELGASAFHLADCRAGSTPAAGRH